MFTVQVNTDGLERKLGTLAVQAQDLNKPLRQFGGYLKRKALERYKAQDFPPLARSTLEKRAASGLRSMERKLLRDVRKARGRAPKVEQPRGILARILGSPAMFSAVETRGVRSRLAVLQEFKRQHDRGGTLLERTDLKALSLKQMVSLGQRTERAVAKAVGKPILGNLTRSLKVEVSHGNVTLASRTKQKFSDVHNEGGSAGHGAKIPKRETIRLDEPDLDVLIEILKEHMLLAFEE